MNTTLTKEQETAFSKVQDTELDDLLQEIRDKFDNRWFIQSETVTRTNWIGKKESSTLYTLYNKISETEAIKVKFKRKSTVYTLVPKHYIMIYLYGMLEGNKKREMERDHSSYLMGVCEMKAKMEREKEDLLDWVFEEPQWTQWSQGKLDSKALIEQFDKVKYEL